MARCVVSVLAGVFALSMHLDASLVLCALQSQGRLKITPCGLAWRRDGGGKSVEVPQSGAPGLAISNAVICHWTKPLQLQSYIPAKSKAIAIAIALHVPASRERVR